MRKAAPASRCLPTLTSITSRTTYFFFASASFVQNIAMPWLMGKDSNVLLWLAHFAASC
jgi:hypothetical protein